MILTRSYKRITQIALRHLNTCAISKNVKEFSNPFSYSKTKLLRIFYSPNLQQFKYCSNDSQDSVKLPPLRDEPKIVWATFFKSVQTMLLTSFVIPRHDGDFNMLSFLEGSQQALYVISNALANEDFESIQDLVDTETLEITKNRVRTLTLAQKQTLAIKKEDIYLNVPYEVRLKTVEDDVQKTFLEIMVIYHSMEGFNKMEDVVFPFAYSKMPEHRKNVVVSNYNFVREVTEGVESSWTVNFINHFMIESVA